MKRLLPLFCRTIKIAAFVLLAIPAFPQFNVTPISQYPKRLTDIFMVNTTVGYAGGIDGIFKTTDGGATWVPTPQFVPPVWPSLGDEVYVGFNDIYLHFLSPQEGYAVGWNAYTNSEEILYTSDGGTTWTNQHLFNPNNDAFQSIEERLKDIVSVGPNTLITVGHYGRILKTTDGGANWVVKNTSEDHEIEAVDFLNSSVGIAAGDQVVYMTSDGGETWNFYPCDFEIRDVEYLSADNLLAVTGNGRILHSKDGGKSWMDDRIGSFNTLNRISFVDDQTGFVAGANLLLKTIDAGASFERYVIDQAYIHSVFALGESAVFMVSEAGQVYSPTGPIPFLPYSYFTYENKPICANSGTPVDFTNKGRNDYQYKWLVDDVEKSTDHNFSYLFTGEGMHTVSLVTSGSGGSDTYSQNFLVQDLYKFQKEFQFNATADTIESAMQDDFNSVGVYDLTPGAEYQMFRDGIPISAKELAWSSTGTFPLGTGTGGNYTYKLRGEYTNTCGVSVQEKEFSRYVLDVPRRPTDLVIRHLEENGVELTWKDNSTQEDLYYIERMEEGGAFEVIGTTTAYYFTDPGPLTTHRRYYYRVYGKNSYGMSKYCNAVSAFIHGDIIYVNPASTGTSDGSTWQNALTSFAQACKESTGDDEIWVVAGTYSPTPGAGWSILHTKGVYGGFAGNETLRTQRDWRNNKTILTGESTKQSQIISMSEGNLDGFTIRDGKYGVGIARGMISNCIIENNLVGAGASRIDNCIIRNNVTGVVAKDEMLLSSSFIYNNTLGVTGYDVLFSVDNCLLYANKSGSLSVRSYYNIQVAQVSNSVFGYRQGDIQIEGINLVGAGHSIYETSLSGGRYDYHMDYMSGPDLVLGNDDDLLIFPAEDLHDVGELFLGKYYYGQNYTPASDFDFFGHPRIAGQAIDMGPVEFPSDTIRVPNLKVDKSNTTYAKLSWPKVQAGVTRIWLERKWIDHEIVFIPIDKNATSYEDNDIEPYREYTYAMHLQKGGVVSWAGQISAVNTYPKVHLTGSAVNYRTNKLEFSFSDPYDLRDAQLWMSIDNGTNWSSVTQVYPTPAVNDYIHWHPLQEAGESIQYKITGAIYLTPDSYTGVDCDVITVVTPGNEAPAIISQKEASIVQGESIVIREDLVEVTDDFDFPDGILLKVEDGENYNHAGNTILVNPDFTGSLYVNVRVSDYFLESEPFAFLITVEPNEKPLITGQVPSRMLEGETFMIKTEHLVLEDDRNFPMGSTLLVFIGDHYELNNGVITPDPGFIGLLTVTVVVSDGYLLSDPYQFNLAVIEKITADITSDVEILEEAVSVTFNADIHGSPGKITWHFEGGDPSEFEGQSPPPILYTVPGSYDVELILEDDLQYVSVLKEDFISFEKTITETEHPVPHLDVYPNPSSGVITIQHAGDLSPEMIAVSDDLGKSINVSIGYISPTSSAMRLRPGYYIIAIRTRNGNVYRKVVVK